MKSIILMLCFLLFTTHSFSNEFGNTTGGVANPATDGDTVVLFRENFNDGDFTNNPQWSANVVQMCAPNPARIAVNKGVLKISQQDARTCGNWAQLTIAPDIPVSNNTKISFDVKPAYSSVEDGAGWKNEEYPIGIRLKLINHKNEFKDIWFCYNYRGGASFLYKDHIRMVFPYCDQDSWIKNEVYRIRDFFPDAEKIIEFSITGSGWDYEGYADNILIFDSDDDSSISDEFYRDQFEFDTISKTGYEKAIEGYRESMRIATMAGDMVAQVKWLMLIGDGYFRLNLFDSAMANYSKAIEMNLLQHLPNGANNAQLIQSYKGLLKIFKLQNNYEKALEVLEPLSEEYKKVNNVLEDIRTRFEKAEIYYLTSDIQKAEKTYNEIISMSREISNQQFVAKAFQKLGDLYLNDKHYQKALSKYQSALDVFQQSGDLNSMATLLLDIGNVHFILKAYNDAIAYLNQSLETAKMRNLESLQSNIYIKLSEIYDEIGDKEIALRYFKLYSQTRTILFDREKNQVLAEQYVKYETEIKDQQIDLLKKDNEIQELSIRQKSNQLYFTLSFGGLVILLLLFVYLRYRSKQKANKLLTQQNELITRQKIEIEQQVKEKETMLRELHHRVKNNLQTIYSMLSIQSRKLKDPEALAIIRPNIDRVWAMALIHHKLYRDEKLTSINVSQYINELIENILRTNWAGKTELKIHQEIEIEYLEADVAIPLGLIVNEMLCNAIKHAFTGITKPEFNITINEINANEFKLIGRDNGIGIPEKVISDHSGSFGLELINLLVAQLKGTIEIENDNGTCFTFILKH